MVAESERVNAWKVGSGKVNVWLWVGLKMELEWRGSGDGGVATVI
jgi:hypothetical protein